MAEERVRQLAEILVDYSLDVQAGEKVILASEVLARPLLMEVLRLVTRRGAEGVLDLTFAETGGILLSERPENLLDQLPEVADYIYRHADCLLSINAPENPFESANVPSSRKKRAQLAMRPLREHVLSHLRWVGCDFPTASLAQAARLPLSTYEELFYQASLIDWRGLSQRLKQVKEILDGAARVEILGAETELVLSLAGRSGTVGDGKHTLPDGEVSWAPNETATEGRISFDIPSNYAGQEVEGIILEFAGGHVVKAQARQGEAVLLAALETDEGARVAGEFGLGGNPGITRPMNNSHFNRKMAGTVYLTLGISTLLEGRGTNVSALHWDLIKDLRQDGEIRVDGRVLLKNGQFVL